MARYQLLLTLDLGSCSRVGKHSRWDVTPLVTGEILEQFIKRTQSFSQIDTHRRGEVSDRAVVEYSSFHADRNRALISGAYLVY